MSYDIYFIIVEILMNVLKTFVNQSFLKKVFMGNEKKQLIFL